MSKIAKILELTDSLETLVVEGRWSEATALESQRRELLEDYSGSSAKDSKVLDKLLVRNEDLLGDVLTLRGRARDAMIKKLNSTRAVDAYEGEARRKTD